MFYKNWQLRNDKYMESIEPNHIALKNNLKNFWSFLRKVSELKKHVINIQRTFFRQIAQWIDRI